MDLIARARDCKLCVAELPQAPRPILQGTSQSKILIAGQAPGATTREKGIPFDDPSGERLREWMGVSRAEFYDENLVSILPMSFCFPGYKKSADGKKNLGDLPPIPRCAQTWRADLLAEMNHIQLTLVIGQYAQAWHLPEATRSAKNLTELVKGWRQFGPAIVPMPHPSPRNNRWLKLNPWFEAEVLPALRSRIAAIIRSPGSPAQA